MELIPFRKLHFLDSVGYIDLMSLAKACTFVVINLGGLQKEAYYAQKRSIVVMPDTGWRELIDIGCNKLSPPTKQALLQNVQELHQEMPYPEHLYGNGQLCFKNIIDVLRGEVEPEADGREGLNSLEVLMPHIEVHARIKPYPYP